MPAWRCRNHSTSEGAMFVNGVARISVSKERGCTNRWHICRHPRIPDRLIHVIERRTPRRSTGQSVATNKHESASCGILAHDPMPKLQQNHAET
jgi:hypothetical protein